MKFKKYFLLFTVVYLFLSYTHIFAAEVTGAPGDYNYKNAGIGNQIKQYLCAPTDASRTGGAGAANVAQGDLYACINKLYRFAIVIGAAIGVFYLVIAGYMYMGSDGNQESVDKAKDMLASTLTAFVILLAGYILLKAINPDLIQFKQIQPGSLVDLTKFSTSTDFRIPNDVPPGQEGGVPTNIINKCASEAGGPCPSCQDYTSASYGLTKANGTQRSGCNTFLNTSLLNKLKTAKQSAAFSVTEAFPPTVNHMDSCHSNGTCADVVATSRTDASKVDEVCRALKAAGIATILNEYTNIPANQFRDCPAPRAYKTTTGPHLHVK